MRNIADNLRKLIREHRKAQGMTQAEVAEKLGISRLSYRAIEIGQRQLTRTRIGEICAAIGCDAARLMRSAGYDFTEE